MARGAEGAAPVIKVVDFGVSALRAGDTDPGSATTNANASPLGSPQSTVKEIADRESRALALEITDAAGLLSANPTPSPVTTARLPGQPLRADNLTQTGVIMGTPLYMAPELVRGARLARPASDIFSFGIIAYELVTGRLPSETPPMLLPLKPFARWYPALAMKCPDLPEHLGGLIERCLDVAPENRPAAAELATALRKWLERPATG